MRCIEYENSADALLIVGGVDGNVGIIGKFLGVVCSLFHQTFFNSKQFFRDLDTRLSRVVRSSQDQPNEIVTIQPSFNGPVCFTMDSKCQVTILSRL